MERKSYDPDQQRRISDDGTRRLHLTNLSKQRDGLTERHLRGPQERSTVVPGDEVSGDSSAESDSISAHYELKRQPLELNTTATALLVQHREEQLSPALEQTLDLLVWNIPFSALFVLLDIMIQQQYAMHPTLWIELGRMLSALPFLIILIWVTTIKPCLPCRVLQPIFFFGALGCGCAFIWTFHKAPFLQVVRRTPPLGCLWIYCIVKLDLLPCLMSLGGVGFFIWFYNLPILSDRL